MPADRRVTPAALSSLSMNLCWSGMLYQCAVGGDSVLRCLLLCLMTGTAATSGPVPMITSSLASHQNVRLLNMASYCRGMERISTGRYQTRAINPCLHGSEGGTRASRIVSVRKASMSRVLVYGNVLLFSIHSPFVLVRASAYQSVRRLPSAPTFQPLDSHIHRCRPNQIPANRVRIDVMVLCPLPHGLNVETT